MSWFIFFSFKFLIFLKVSSSLSTSTQSYLPFLVILEVCNFWALESGLQSLLKTGAVFFGEVATFFFFRGDYELLLWSTKLEECCFLLWVSGLSLNQEPLSKFSETYASSKSWLVCFLIYIYEWLLLWSRTVFSFNRVLSTQSSSGTEVKVCW